MLSLLFLRLFSLFSRFITPQSIATTKSQIIAGNVDLQLYAVDGVLCFPTCSISNYYAEMNVTYIAIYTLPSQYFTGLRLSLIIPTPLVQSIEMSFQNNLVNPWPEIGSYSYGPHLVC